jgi:biotin carboxyl carrier protein
LQLQRSAQLLSTNLSGSKKPADEALNSKAQSGLSIELTASDIVNAQSISMTQGLPISGTLKAIRSAMVKARVAGELLALEVREGDAVQAGQIIAKVDPTEYLGKTTTSTTTSRSCTRAS